VGRFERWNRASGEGNPRGETHGSMVGHLVGLLLERHPSFSTNPLGDWKELVGDQVARYCQPKSLKQRVLMVVAYDSVWKYHLDLHKDALIEKINLGHSEPLVEKIVVRVGELAETAPPLNPTYQRLEKSKAGKTRLKTRKKPPSRPLTPDEKALLKSLQDPDLRAIGTRLLKRIPLESKE
jgi:hypothetical protein